MRLAALALSAAVIGGCSYSGGPGSGFGNFFNGASHGHYNQKPQMTRCHVPHHRAPAPAGCHPSQIRVMAAGQHGYGQGHPQMAGGFPQQPQFGQPQYATGGYGSHAAGNIHAPSHRKSVKSAPRRPKFRGTLDLTAEQSVSGDILDYDKINISPINGYDPSDYDEGNTVGDVASGSITRTRWFANSRLTSNPNQYDEASIPSVSFDDAWLVPSTIGLGGEYILSDKATLFARAGYTRAEGTSGDAASIEGTIYQEITNETYDDMNALVGTTVNTTFETGQIITDYSYDFTDMERLDLEAGGRFYLDPISGHSTGKTITPFVGASAGVSRYNDVAFTIDQRQLSYSSVFQEENPEYYDLDVAGYDLDNNPATPATRTVELYDSQWVPSGSLKAGVEWQVTSKTALAFETGLRVEGARDYSNGNKGDTNVTVPLTLRGSFNF